MMQTNNLEISQSILTQYQAAEGLDLETRQLMILEGAVFELFLSAEPESVKILEQVAWSHLRPSIRQAAFSALQLLASQGNQDAIDSIFILDTLYDNPVAREFIQKNKLAPTDKRLLSAHYLLVQDVQELYKIDPELSLATDLVIKDFSTSIDAIQFAAMELNLSNWAEMLQVFRSSDLNGLNNLKSKYPDFENKERAIFLELLRKFALNFEVAQDVLCELYIDFEDQEAFQIVQRFSYTPHNLLQKALFYFLCGAWEPYEKLDVNHTMIRNAYELANADLKRRILAQSRQSGQLDWLDLKSAHSPSRLIRDLNDQDWQHTIQWLSAGAHWDQLWRLAPIAPSYWSIKILHKLAKSGWLPAENEQEGYLRLRDLAQLCPEIIRLSPYKSLHTISKSLTSIAINSTSTLLAAGCSEQSIYLWRFPECKSIFNTLVNPVPQTRCLAFSPDEKYLACANGDNIIRIFQLETGKIVKTLSGHSGIIKSLLFSPDSRSLYSCGFDGSLRAWRFPLGPELKTFCQTNNELFGAAITPNAQFVFTAGPDNKVTGYKLPDGGVSRELFDAAQNITVIAASHNRGEYIAGYSRNEGVFLWNYQSGRLISKITDLPQTVTGLSFLPDMRTIAIAGLKGALQINSTTSAIKIADLSHHENLICGLASDNTMHLISASNDGEIALWNINLVAWAMTPLVDFAPGKMEEIDDLYKSKQTSQSEKAYLQFIIQAVQWRLRYDIQIGDAAVISVGEFDIQL
jgi:WD40 repeat protein